VRFALMTEPQQGLSYDQIAAAARHAETAGFEAFFRSDHYGSFPGGKDHPTTDAWTTIAGISRETERIRLGTLVSPVTFRHPGSLAKIVATVDEMSGGRVELGVGSGWNDDEHAQLGLRFPPLGERFDMLEEELEILHGLWREPDGWSFDGRHWQIRDTLLRPRPVQRPHPPIILGGTGKPRSVRLAARWADEYNLQGVTPADVPPHRAALEEAVADAGRPPGSVVLSAMIGVLVAADDVELDARLERLMAVFELSSTDADAWLALRRPRYLMGTPDQILERVREYEAAGLERIMLQDWLPTDLDMLSLIGREVLPYA
jgi:F420-dependent oxidoreductase-like protein